MLTLDNIYRASYVLKEVIRRTDLIKAPSINPGSEIYLKPENLQVTGSFKVRGAYYKISQLTDEEKAKESHWLPHTAASSRSSVSPKELPSARWKPPGTWVQTSAW